MKKIDFESQNLAIFYNFYSTDRKTQNLFKVLGLKEGLVKCATVCVKSVVILLFSLVYQQTSVPLYNLEAKKDLARSKNGYCNFEVLNLISKNPK